MEEAYGTPCICAAQRDSGKEDSSEKPLERSAALDVSDKLLLLMAYLFVVRRVMDTGKRDAEAIRAKASICINILLELFGSRLVFTTSKSDERATIILSVKIISLSHIICSITSQLRKGERIKSVTRSESDTVILSIVKACPLSIQQVISAIIILKKM